MKPKYWSKAEMVETVVPHSDVNGLCHLAVPMAVMVVVEEMLCWLQHRVKIPSKISEAILSGRRNLVSQVEPEGVQVQALQLLRSLFL
jgi:hypothetical protein